MSKLGAYDPCDAVAAWFHEMLEPGETATMPMRAFMRLYPQEPIAPATILARIRAAMPTQWDIRCEGEEVTLTRLC